MKKIKKATAILLTAVLIFAIGQVAFGAQTSASDTGSITIHGLESGVTANAYQIAAATYDEYGNFLGYEMAAGTGDCVFQIAADGSYDEDALTEANLAALFAALDGVSRTGYATASSEDTEVEGKYMATIDDLPVGAYLIVISGSESVAYGMMIGSVSYDVDNTGDWTLDEGSISTSSLDNLWAKAATPVLTKTEHHDGEGETHGESTNIGDQITYDIRINNIPSYEGEYPVFYVNDTLTNLTISEGELAALTVTIMNGEETIAVLAKDTDYTVTPTGAAPYAQFEVNFVVGGKYTLNGFAGQDYTIVIEYPVTVAETALHYTGEVEYDNDGILTYVTDSYFEQDPNNPDLGTSEDQDYEYSFPVGIWKTGTDFWIDDPPPSGGGGGGSAGNSVGDVVKGDVLELAAPRSYSQGLSGAVFTLYTDAACTVEYQQKGQTVTATSDANGYLEFIGLREGTYYLKETAAPVGYLLNTAVYKIEITAEYEGDGQLSKWSITITNEDGEVVGSATNDADTGLILVNTKTGLLPSMGGRGTVLFTIIGCAIVAGAAAGIVATRRKRAA